VFHDAELEPVQEVGEVRGEIWVLGDQNFSGARKKVQGDM
jgi:hypothetical protein